MRCFFCENIIVGENVVLGRDDNKHLFKTLRGAPGDFVQLCDGLGRIGEAEILPERQLVVRKVESFSEPQVKIHLYVSPPRRNKMDTLLKQSAETGIWRIVPVISENSVVVPDKISDRQLTLLREGCKQSRNPFLPQMSDPVKFTEALDDSSSLDAVFYGDMTRAKSATELEPPLNIGFFVGPEGGFTDTEVELMKEKGCIPVSLGSWILRTETAVVAGAAVLQYMFKNQ